MNDTLPRIVRLGAVLSVVVALLAFLVRALVGADRRLSQRRRAHFRLATPRVSPRRRPPASRARSFACRRRRRASTQSKSALLPQVDASPELDESHASTARRSDSTFRRAPGQRPLLDPNGQIIGPVRIWDFRGKLSSRSMIRGAISASVRRAPACTRGVAPTSRPPPSKPRRMRPSVYVRALRSDAALQARIADSTLAADLLGIARDQLDGRCRRRARRDARPVAARDVARAAHRRAQRSRSLAPRLAARAESAARYAARAHAIRSSTLPLPPSRERAGGRRSWRCTTRPDIRAATAQLDRRAATVRRHSQPTRLPR